MDHDEDRSLSLGTEISVSVPPPSPLTGCYLLAVIGEPHTEEHKEIILQRLVKGLQSWDSNEHQVDLEKELMTLTAQAPEGEDARNGERLIQFASENLVTEILIHPQMNTLMQCMRNLLSSFTRHRHLIHAGYTFAGNGSWIVQDGTFSLADFTDAYQENEVQRVIRAYENSISIDIHCSTVGGGEWANLPEMPFVKYCKLRVNPTDILDSGSQAIKDFVGYLNPYIVPASLEQLLVSSDVVGNIRFSHPTLYVFPGGQGDAALFGINGFNMLVDGGFSRKACWWDFARHLDRLDAVMLTRVNNCSVAGMAAVLKRKAGASVYPHIGHFFCNLEERRVLSSPDGDKDSDPLLVSLLQEGSDMMADVRHINLKPQHCWRSPDPINLYHKVGHGTLDMYVLNPSKDSKHVRDFLKKWHDSEQKLFEGPSVSGPFNFPIPNIVSICALLVWRPANPDENVTRLMFPGSTPQHKIFEGLEKLKHLEFLQHPKCTGRQITATPSPVPTAVHKTVKRSSTKITKDKLSTTEKKDEKTEKESVIKTGKDRITSENKSEKIYDANRTEKFKDETDSKNYIDNKLINELIDGEDKKIESVLREAITSRVETKLDSTSIESITKKQEFKKKEKFITENKIKRIEKTEDNKEATLKSEAKKSENENKVKMDIRKKIDTKVTSTTTRAKSTQKTSQKVSDKKVVTTTSDKKLTTDKSPPSTPKKTSEIKATKEPTPPASARIKTKIRKQSPGSTQAKSTKEANNRRVVESKYKQASPKRELTVKSTEKKEIKVKREPISRRPRPLGSPVKAVKVMKSPTKAAKSIRTDPKLKGLQRVNYEDILKDAKKSDEENSKSIDDFKQDIDDKEEQEIVREIEAVFNRDSEADEKIEYVGRSDIEKITCLIGNAKTEAAGDGEFEEEYLIIEKEEIDQYTEDSVLDHEPQEQEDELQKHAKDKKESEKKKDVTEIASQIIDVEEEITVDIKQIESKEHSLSVEEKQDLSSEKKTSDSKNGQARIKSLLPETQQDEKISSQITVESGATTTAPTLPEDERITLDDIKEDNQVEEKYVNEETKEILPPQTLRDIPMDRKVNSSQLRDIVKTPDEVADLPLHEEVDYQTYEEKKTPLDENKLLLEDSLEKQIKIKDNDVFKRLPDVGFVHEIIVPKNLPIPDQTENITAPSEPEPIEGDVIVTTLQKPSHAELVTVSPGSAPESPMYPENKIIKDMLLEKPLDTVKEYEGAEYCFGFTEKLRETHITTVESPLKETADIGEEILCLPDKIPSIPEDVEKEMEEAKLFDGEKSPKSPKEVEKIVASVAEVLKSDKSLEELIPHKPTLVYDILISRPETTENIVPDEIDVTESQNVNSADSQRNLDVKDYSPARSATPDEVSDGTEKTVLSESKKLFEITPEINIIEKSILETNDLDLKMLSNVDDFRPLELTKDQTISASILEAEMPVILERKLSSTLDSAKTLEKLEEKMTELRKKDEGNYGAESEPLGESDDKTIKLDLSGSEGSEIQPYKVKKKGSTDLDDSLVIEEVHALIIEDDLKTDMVDKETKLDLEKINKDRIGQDSALPQSPEIKPEIINKTKDSIVIKVEEQKESPKAIEDAKLECLEEDKDVVDQTVNANTLDQLTPNLTSSEIREEKIDENSPATEEDNRENFKDDMEKTSIDESVDFKGLPEILEECKDKDTSFKESSPVSRSSETVTIEAKKPTNVEKTVMIDSLQNTAGTEATSENEAKDLSQSVRPASNKTKQQSSNNSPTTLGRDYSAILIDAEKSTQSTILTIEPEFEITSRKDSTEGKDSLQVTYDSEFEIESKESSRSVISAIKGESTEKKSQNVPGDMDQSAKTSRMNEDAIANETITAKNLNIKDYIEVMPADHVDHMALDAQDQSRTSSQTTKEPVADGDTNSTISREMLHYDTQDSSIIEICSKDIESDSPVIETLKHTRELSKPTSPSPIETYVTEVIKVTDLTESFKSDHKDETTIITGSSESGQCASPAIEDLAIPQTLHHDDATASNNESSNIEMISEKFSNSNLTEIKETRESSSNVQTVSDSAANNEDSQEISLEDKPTSKEQSPKESRTSSPTTKELTTDKDTDSSIPKQILHDDTHDSLSEDKCFKEIESGSQVKETSEPSLKSSQVTSLSTKETVIAEMIEVTDQKGSMKSEHKDKIIIITESSEPDQSASPANEDSAIPISHHDDATASHEVSSNIEVISKKYSNTDLTDIKGTRDSSSHEQSVPDNSAIIEDNQEMSLEDKPNGKEQSPKKSRTSSPTTKELTADKDTDSSTPKEILHEDTQDSLTGGIYSKEIESGRPVKETSEPSLKSSKVNSLSTKETVIAEIIEVTDQKESLKSDHKDKIIIITGSSEPDQSASPAKEDSAIPQISYHDDETASNEVSSNIEVISKEYSATDLTDIKATRDSSSHEQSIPESLAINDNSQEISLTDKPTSKEQSPKESRSSSPTTKELMADKDTDSLIHKEIIHEDTQDSSIDEIYSKEIKSGSPVKETADMSLKSSTSSSPLSKKTVTAEVDEVTDQKKSFKSDHKDETTIINESIEPGQSASSAIKDSAKQQISHHDDTTASIEVSSNIEVITKKYSETDLTDIMALRDSSSHKQNMQDSSAIVEDSQEISLEDKPTGKEQSPKESRTSSPTTKELTADKDTYSCILKEILHDDTHDSLTVDQCFKEIESCSQVKETSEPSLKSSQVTSLSTKETVIAEIIEVTDQKGSFKSEHKDEIIIITGSSEPDQSASPVKEDSAKPQISYYDYKTASNEVSSNIEVITKKYSDTDLTDIKETRDSSSLEQNLPDSSAIIENNQEISLEDKPSGKEQSPKESRTSSPTTKELTADKDSDSSIPKEILHDDTQDSLIVEISSKEIKSDSPEKQTPDMSLKSNTASSPLGKETVTAEVDEVTDQRIRLQSDHKDEITINTGSSETGQSASPAKEDSVIPQLSLHGDATASNDASSNIKMISKKYSDTDLTDIKATLVSSSHVKSMPDSSAIIEDSQEIPLEYKPSSKEQSPKESRSSSPTTKMVTADKDTDSLIPKEILHDDTLDSSIIVKYSKEIKSGSPVKETTDISLKSSSASSPLSKETVTAEVDEVTEQKKSLKSDHKDETTIITGSSEPVVSASPAIEDSVTPHTSHHEDTTGSIEVSSNIEVITKKYSDSDLTEIKATRESSSHEQSMPDSSAIIEDSQEISLEDKPTSKEQSPKESRTSSPTTKELTADKDTDSSIPKETLQHDTQDSLIVEISSKEIKSGSPVKETPDMSLISSTTGSPLGKETFTAEVDEVTDQKESLKSDHKDEIIIITGSSEPDQSASPGKEDSAMPQITYQDDETASNEGSSNIEVISKEYSATDLTDIKATRDSSSHEQSIPDSSAIIEDSQEMSLEDKPTGKEQSTKESRTSSPTTKELTADKGTDSSIPKETLHDDTQDSLIVKISSKEIKSGGPVKETPGMSLKSSTASSPLGKGKVTAEVDEVTDQKESLKSDHKDEIIIITGSSEPDQSASPGKEDSAMPQITYQDDETASNEGSSNIEVISKEYSATDLTDIKATRDSSSHEQSIPDSSAIRDNSQEISLTDKPTSKEKSPKESRTSSPTTKELTADKGTDSSIPKETLHDDTQDSLIVKISSKEIKSGGPVKETPGMSLKSSTASSPLGKGKVTAEVDEVTDQKESLKSDHKDETTIITESSEPGESASPAIEDSAIPQTSHHEDTTASIEVSSNIEVISKKYSETDLTEIKATRESSSHEQSMPDSSAIIEDSQEISLEDKPTSKEQSPKESRTSSPTTKELTADKDTDSSIPKETLQDDAQDSLIVEISSKEIKSGSPVKETPDMSLISSTAGSPLGKETVTTEVDEVIDQKESLKSDHKDEIIIITGSSEPDQSASPGKEDSALPQISYHDDETASNEGSSNIEVISKEYSATDLTDIKATRDSSSHEQSIPDSSAIKDNSQEISLTDKPTSKEKSPKESRTSSPTTKGLTADKDTDSSIPKEILHDDTHGLLIVEISSKEIKSGKPEKETPDMSLKSNTASSPLGQEIVTAEVDEVTDQKESLKSDHKDEIIIITGSSEPDQSASPAKEDGAMPQISYHDDKTASNEVSSNIEVISTKYSETDLTEIKATRESSSHEQSMPDSSAIIEDSQEISLEDKPAGKEQSPKESRTSSPTTKELTADKDTDSSIPKETLHDDTQDSLIVEISSKEIKSGSPVKETTDISLKSSTASSPLGKGKVTAEVDEVTDQKESLKSDHKDETTIITESSEPGESASPAIEDSAIPQTSHHEDTTASIEVSSNIEVISKKYSETDLTEIKATRESSSHEQSMPDSSAIVEDSQEISLEDKPTGIEQSPKESRTSSPTTKELTADKDTDSFIPKETLQHDTQDSLIVEISSKEIKSGSPVKGTPDMSLKSSTASSPLGKGKVTAEVDEVTDQKESLKSDHKDETTIITESSEPGESASPAIEDSAIPQTSHHEDTTASIEVSSSIEVISKKYSVTDLTEIKATRESSSHEQSMPDSSAIIEDSQEISLEDKPTGIEQSPKESRTSSPTTKELTADKDTDSSIPKETLQHDTKDSLIVEISSKEIKSGSPEKQTPDMSLISSTTGSPLGKETFTAEVDEVTDQKESLKSDHKDEIIIITGSSEPDQSASPGKKDSAMPQITYQDDETASNEESSNIEVISKEYSATDLTDIKATRDSSSHEQSIPDSSAINDNSQEISLTDKPTSKEQSPKESRTSSPTTKGLTADKDTDSSIPKEILHDDTQDSFIVKISSKEIKSGKPEKETPDISLKSSTASSPLGQEIVTAEVDEVTDQKESLKSNHKDEIIIITGSTEPDQSASPAKEDSAIPQLSLHGDATASYNASSNIKMISKKYSDTDFTDIKATLESSSHVQNMPDSSATIEDSQEISSEYKTTGKEKSPKESRTSSPTTKELTADKDTDSSIPKETLHDDTQDSLIVEISSKEIKPGKPEKETLDMSLKSSTASSPLGKKTVTAEVDEVTDQKESLKSDHKDETTIITESSEPGESASPAIEDSAIRQTFHHEDTTASIEVSSNIEVISKKYSKTDLTDIKATRESSSHEQSMPGSSAIIEDSQEISLEDKTTGKEQSPKESRTSSPTTKELTADKDTDSSIPKETLHDDTQDSLIVEISSKEIKSGSPEKQIPDMSLISNTAGSPSGKETVTAEVDEVTDQKESLKSEHKAEIIISTESSEPDQSAIPAIEDSAIPQISYHDDETASIEVSSNIEVISKKYSDTDLTLIKATRDSSSHEQSIQDSSAINDDGQEISLEDKPTSKEQSPKESRSSSPTTKEPAADKDTDSLIPKEILHDETQDSSIVEIYSKEIKSGSLVNETADMSLKSSTASSPLSKETVTAEVYEVTDRKESLKSEHKDETIAVKETSESSLKSSDEDPSNESAMYKSITKTVGEYSDVKAPSAALEDSIVSELPTSAIEQDEKNMSDKIASLLSTVTIETLNTSFDQGLTSPPLADDNDVTTINVEILSKAVTKPAFVDDRQTDGNKYVTESSTKELKDTNENAKVGLSSVVDLNIVENDAKSQIIDQNKDTVTTSETTISDLVAKPSSKYFEKTKITSFDDVISTQAKEDTKVARTSKQEAFEDAIVKATLIKGQFQSETEGTYKSTGEQIMNEGLTIDDKAHGIEVQNNITKTMQTIEEFLPHLRKIESPTNVVQSNDFVKPVDLTINTKVKPSNGHVTVELNTKHVCEEDKKHEILPEKQKQTASTEATVEHSVKISKTVKETYEHISECSNDHMLTSSAFADITEEGCSTMKKDTDVQILNQSIDTSVKQSKTKTANGHIKQQESEQEESMSYISMKTDLDSYDSMSLHDQDFAKTLKDEDIVAHKSEFSHKMHGEETDLMQKSFVSIFESTLKEDPESVYTLASSSEDISKEISCEEKHSFECLEKESKKQNQIHDITTSSAIKNEIYSSHRENISTKTAHTESGSPKDISLSMTTDSGIMSLQADNKLGPFEGADYTQTLKDNAINLMESVSKAFSEDSVQQGIKTESVDSFIVRSEFERVSTPPTVPVSPLPKTPISVHDLKVTDGLQSELTYDKSEGAEETITKVIHVGDDILTQKISTSTEKAAKPVKVTVKTDESDLSSLMHSMGKIRTETDTVTKIIKEGVNVVTQTITTVTTKEIISREDGTPQNVKTTIETTTLSKGSDGSTTTTKDTKTLLSECSSSLKSTSQMDVYAKDIKLDKEGCLDTSEEKSESLSSQISDKETSLRSDLSNTRIKSGQASPLRSEFITTIDDDTDDNIEYTVIDTDVSKKIIKEGGLDIVETVITTTKKEVLKLDDATKILRITTETNITKERPDGSKDTQKNVDVRTEEIHCETKQPKEEAAYKITSDDQIGKKSTTNQQSSIVHNNQEMTESQRSEDTHKAGHESVSSEIPLEQVLEEFTKMEDHTVNVDTQEKTVSREGVLIKQNITITTTKEILTSEDGSKKKLKTTIETVTESKLPNGASEVVKDIKISIADYGIENAGKELEGYDCVGEPDEQTSSHTEEIYENNVKITRKTTVTTIRQEFENITNRARKIKTIVRTVIEDEHPNGTILTKKSEKTSIADVFLKTPQSESGELQICDAYTDDSEVIEDVSEDTDVKSETIQKENQTIIRTVTTKTKRETLNSSNATVKRIRTTVETITVDEYPNGATETTKDIKITVSEIQTTSDSELQSALDGLQSTGKIKTSVDKKHNITMLDGEEVKQTITINVTKEEFKCIDTGEVAIKTITKTTTETTKKDGSKEISTDLKTQITYLPHGATLDDLTEEHLDVIEKEPVLDQTSHELPLQQKVVLPISKQRSPIGEAVSDTEVFTKHVNENGVDVEQTITVVTTKELVSPDKVKITKETTTVSRGSDGVTKTLKATKTLISDLEEKYGTGESEKSFSKTDDFLSSSAASDDLAHGLGSPPSDLSSRESKATHAWGTESSGLYYSDEDGPGSPSSTKSQIAHSPSSNLSFELEPSKTHGMESSFYKEPMSSSVYAQLPEVSHHEVKTEKTITKLTHEFLTHEKLRAEENIQDMKISDASFLTEADEHFDKAIEEHKKVSGSEVISNITAKYDLDLVQSTSHQETASEESQIILQDIKYDAKKVTDIASSSTSKEEIKSEKSESSQLTTTTTSKDPIESWGKPLGLPSPIMPPTQSDGKSTPKKQNPMLNKNKINQEKIKDARKSLESPSKRKPPAPVYLDLTYVPHHGNSYYSAVEFFKRVRARYYVFSGTEPSKEIYNALLDAKKTWEDKELEVTIIPTYDTDVLGYWVTENEDALEKYKIDLSPSASRCTINLQDHETSCAAYRLEF